MTPIKSAILDLAYESPDNRYVAPEGVVPLCYYAKGECTNGSVGCIVGQAVIRAGHELPEGIDDGEISLGELLALCDSEDDHDWVEAVQSEQDRGTSWLEAVAFADRYY